MFLSTYCTATLGCRREVFTLTPDLLLSALLSMNLLYGKEYCPAFPSFSSIVFLHTAVSQKMCLHTFTYYFAKSWPIVEILSPINARVNLQ